MAIAHALVIKPNVSITVDEPWVALDSIYGINIVEMMQNLPRKKKTTIFIFTHNYRILDVTNLIVKIEEFYLLS
ncbi:MAG: hypothetical protein F6K24_26220 [Okeania sp. SIO2D1]|nr:hypothetical protein [Okeania sp. SIO2D1]